MRSDRLGRTTGAALFGVVAALCVFGGLAVAQPAGFVDARPDAERAFSKGAMSAASCDFMIYGYGDEQAPGRVARLEADLRAKLGERLAGRTVVVERYRKRPAPA